MYMVNLDVQFHHFALHLPRLFLDAEQREFTSLPK